MQRVRTGQVYVAGYKPSDCLRSNSSIMFEKPFYWLDVSICSFDSVKLTAVANRTGKKYSLITIFSILYQLAYQTPLGRTFRVTKVTQLIKVQRLAHRSALMLNLLLKQCYRIKKLLWAWWTPRNVNINWNCLIH